MPQHTPEERLRNALERILKALNDELNKPPREGDAALTAEQLAAGAAALATRRPELGEAAEAAGQLVAPTQASRREVYTAANAQDFLAETLRMANLIWAQQTGRPPDAATRARLNGYLIDNLLREERGAPADALEEIAQQAVEVQGAAVREFPERVLFGQRFRAQLNAQLQEGLIDQETFNALVFPATPIADLPAQFRGRGDVVSTVASAALAESKALGVLRQFETNLPEILRRVVDVPSVADFREAVGKLVSDQTPEDVTAGTNLFSAPESPSQIRARERAEGAAGLFSTEANLGRAVEDLLRQSGRAGDPSLILDDEDKAAATRAKRMFTEGLKQFRAQVLQESPGISDENLAGQVADFASSFIESGRYDRLQTAVTEAFEAEKFSSLSGAEKAIADILGEAGLDADEILPERLTQIAQQAVRAGGINEQGFVDAFPMFARESAARTFVEGGADAITERLEQAAGFRIPDFPGREEALERLSDTIRFRVQRDPFTDIDRLLQGVFRSAQPEGGRGFRALPEATALDRLQGIDEEDVGALGATPAEQRLEGANPLQRAAFEGLRFEPTGGGLISPQEAALITGSPGARQRFGSAPPTLEGLPVFGNVRRSEPPIGFGEITPFLREAAGDELAFLNFLFQPQQLQELQTGFETEQRGLRRQAREDTLQSFRELEERSRALQAVSRPSPDFALTPAEEEALRIGAGPFVGNFEPSLSIPRFVGGQIGGLRERFAATPAGLQEEQRRTAQGESDRRRAESDRRQAEADVRRVESDRRRLLRGGGRTTFRRI